MSNTNKRTHDEGVLDIDYSIRLYELHARFYRRTRFLMTFISLISGTAVVATVMGQHQALAVVASILLALLPILDVLIDPAAKATFFDDYRKQFLKLKASSAALSLEEIDHQLTTLYATPCDEIEPLRRVALRDNLYRHGHEDWLQKPLTRYERLWAAMA